MSIESPASLSRRAFLWSLPAVAMVRPVLDVGAAHATVAPAEPWLPLDEGKPLMRIGVGSCLDQKHPQPIWKSVLAADPDLFLMIGDNVYGDVKSPDLAELREAYALQARHPEFAAARKAFPFLATWDDHDYGLNDGGADFPHRAAAEDIFREFFGFPEKRPGGGIYHSRTIGPGGRRVQIVLLDTRSFRSPLRRKGDDFPHWGRYAPDETPGKTMLGDAQWSWLEGVLREPAEVRLIVSSIQVLAEGHGFERWGNLPLERQRLLDLLTSTGAAGVVLLSGDRHAGAVYRLDRPTPGPLLEMTASSLNRSYGPSKDARMPPLVSGIYHPENFGMVLIDWEKRTLTLELQGMDGVVVTAQTAAFADLGIGLPRG